MKKESKIKIERKYKITPEHFVEIIRLGNLERGSLIIQYYTLAWDFAEMMYEMRQFDKDPHCIETTLTMKEGVGLI